MALMPVNHGASTSAEWRSRLDELKNPAVEAQQQFEAARQARRDADAAAVLSRKPANGLAKLEAAENDAVRCLDSLCAAISMATAGLEETQRAEQVAEQPQLAERRRVLAAEIRLFRSSNARKPNRIKPPGSRRRERDVYDFRGGPCTCLDWDLRRHRASR